MQDFPNKLSAELWTDVPCCICFGGIVDTDFIVEFYDLPAHSDCYYAMTDRPVIRVYGPLDDFEVR